MLCVAGYGVQPLLVARRTGHSAIAKHKHRCSLRPKKKKKKRGCENGTVATRRSSDPYAGSSKHGNMFRASLSSNCVASISGEPACLAALGR